MILEVCVDSAEGLQAAIRGGADRIELCSALAVGGLTPSVGMMEVVSKENIACFAMIRPRAGDFVYDANELESMIRDIEAACEVGLDGVVFGASLPDGRLDYAALERLAACAGGMGKTLHRAFDLVPDLADAIEMAIKLGFDRILTSGRAKTAVEGLNDLKMAVELAAGRISIMPGSGIGAETVDTILTSIQVTEVHASCSMSVSVPDGKIREFGFTSAGSSQTSEAKVRALKSVLARY